MFRIIKKTIPMIMALLVFFSCFSVETFATVGIETDREVSLAIHFLHENTPLDQVEFQFYKVADALSTGEYQLTEDFRAYPINLNNMDAMALRALAQTLVYYAQADELSPLDRAKTDDEGIVVFPSEGNVIYPGLYLVTAEPKVVDGYTFYAEPFLISLPGMDLEGDNWQYELAVRAKYTSEENPDTPGDDVIEHKVLKIWKDDIEQIRPKEVIIQLTQNGKVYKTVALNENNNWSHIWNNLPKYDEQGIKYQWGVIEKDVKDYSVSVSVEGITFVVTNTYDPDSEPEDTVQRTVQKIWDDKGFENKRPKNITVYLLCNGDVYDEQILNDSNGWMYVWQNLPVIDEAGNEIKWALSEENINGYTVKIEEKGDNFILTNSVQKPSLPQTGMLWWPVPVLAATGLLFLIVGGILRRRKENA